MCLAETKGEIISVLPESRQYNPYPHPPKKNPHSFKLYYKYSGHLLNRHLCHLILPTYLTFFSVLVTCTAREKEEQECACSPIWIYPVVRKLSTIVPQYEAFKSCEQLQVASFLLAGRMDQSSLFPAAVSLGHYKKSEPLGSSTRYSILTGYNQRAKTKRQIHNHCASSNRFLIILLFIPGMHSIKGCWSLWKDKTNYKVSCLYSSTWHNWLCVCVQAKLLQSCPALWDSMDHSPPGSSAQGILQTRILEWVAMPTFSRSSWPRGRTHVSNASHTVRQILYH